MRQHWRRFRARLRPTSVAVQRTDLVARMHARLNAVLTETGRAGRHLYVEQLQPVIAEQADRVRLNPDAAEWFALLLLRAPIAARAQQAMDKGTHASRAQQARLFELIDFNDTFVSTVLALSPLDRSGFIDTAKSEITWFCKQVGVHMFSETQYDAITRGLVREIAVYLGAIEQGFGATMTSRAQDAMGVDIIVTDPTTKRSLNIDCKTPSAYRYRLQDLVREGRMSEHEAEQADLRGYAHETNGHGGEAVEVTILRIDPNEVGDIENFVFTDTRLLGGRLREVFGGH